MARSRTNRTSAGGRRRPAPGGRAPTTCSSCGRTIEWRAKWAGSWDDVRYCSAACRRRRVDAVDRDLENAVTELLSERRRGATICPSEAARLVAERRDLDDWRALMESARRAARRLVAAGLVEITQGGRVVDPSTARGPIRIRRRPS